MIIPTKIFIVPFRDREANKHTFSKYMEYIMEDEHDYEIYYAHQCDNRPFNRGAVKNIGFLAMKSKYPTHYKNITFIFNDIDTFPYKKGLLDYGTTSGTIKHFFGFTFALGGIFSITGKDFERINGFPGYWGWGLEDNCIYDRALTAGIKIDRDTFFKIFDQRIVYLMDSIKKMSTKNTGHNYAKDQGIDGINTINQLSFTIEDNMIQINNFNVPSNVNEEEWIESVGGKIRHFKQNRWSMKTMMLKK